MSDKPKVTQAKITDYRPDPQNPNAHSERGIGVLSDSIASVGLGRSIVVDRNGIVLAGNSTQERAVDQGFEDAIEVESDGTKLVVVRRTDLDLQADEDNRARKLSYYDNRAAELGIQWDSEQLLADINAGVDLDRLFSAGELDELLVGINADIISSDVTTTPEQAHKTLAEQFIVPPFSVLDARQGYWQERKRAWLALGIQSEVGRGGGGVPPPHPPTVIQNPDGTLNYSGTHGQAQRFDRQRQTTLGAIASNQATRLSPDYKKRVQNKVSPGGSLRPAATLVDGKTVRGDGVGRRIQGKLPADNGGQPLPLDRMKNGKSPARTFAQDLMRGEHVVGVDTRAITTQSWIASVEGEDFTGLSANQSGTSIFDPVLCELAYRWFSPPDGAVLDPFAGGSVRGIVASILGRQYTGIDLRPEQVEANVAQAASITPDKLPRWITGDSRNLDSLTTDEYDFVFSCPPYFDLEIYSDNAQDLSNTGDYAAFLADYRTIIAACIGRLKNNRFACFCVGDIRDKKGIYRNFVSDTIAAFQDAGALLYNEAILVTSVGSLPIRVRKQFKSGRKLGKTHQNVLCFIKGDPRKAVEACGYVEAFWPEGLEGAQQV